MYRTLNKLNILCWQVVSFVLPWKTPEFFSFSFITVRITDSDWKSPVGLHNSGNTTCLHRLLGFVFLWSGIFCVQLIFWFWASQQVLQKVMVKWWSCDGGCGGHRTSCPSPAPACWQWNDITSGGPFVPLFRSIEILHTKAAWSCYLHIWVDAALLKIPNKIKRWRNQLSVHTNWLFLRSPIGCKPCCSNWTHKSPTEAATQWMQNVTKQKSAAFLYFN